MHSSKNLDPAELEKFSSNADHWWDKEGIFKTLHDINPVRLDFIENHCPLNGLRVLDVGCGGGILSEAMTNKGALVTGLDASVENIKVAVAHASENNLSIDYVVSTAENYANDHDQQYDLITCMELLEHVPDPTSIIKACSNMVKPGGHVMLSTINRSPKAYAFSVIVAEYLLQLLPKGTHHYKNFIRPSELVSWCKQYGLALNKLNGLYYNPLIKRCSLKQKPDINYLVDTIAV